MNNQYVKSMMGLEFPGWITAFVPLIIILIIWNIVWKGLALWHSSRRSNVGWFIALLFLNTAGILEIIYLFLILKLKLKDLFDKNKLESKLE